MYSVKKFTVLPSVPEPLQRLTKLAYNLWWVWNNDAVSLFQRLDRRLWDEVQHNPVMLLAELPQARLERAAADPALLAHADRVMEALDAYMAAPTWFMSTFPEHTERKLAYFSMEFGLHECLPMYSGGLGVLAGDHMKSASDLGIPLVGVGLFYRQGYFQQFLSNDGWQFEDYPDYDIFHLPVKIARDQSGEPVRISFMLADREVFARVLEITVGRVKLFLLDMHVEPNAPEDRALTTRLYGGDQEHRIRQEVALGFGGCRALKALGYDPVIYHMNEGHSAFLALECLREHIELHKLSPAEAREAVAGSTIFTTHTPVPAGIDTFPRTLIEKYLQPYCAKLKISVDDLMAMGQSHPERNDEPFSMATMALNLSHQSNGVSKVHGQVARQMWQGNWDDVPVDEVPITSVTNGVHVQSWLGSDMERLYERYLGPDWMLNPDDVELWSHVTDIPDAELWLAHERSRERLVVEARSLLKSQLARRGAPVSQVVEAEEVLDPEALTIGFARRFAPYKRATLLLRDPDRLRALLTSSDRPIQFIFSGKAHPRDNMGKELIKTLVQFARTPEIRKRFVFLENYNMNIARYLVQGVDVWMNNPTKPLEASGTSGMKVTANGGLNFSVLDGWWSEAYDGSNGWAIGDDRIYDNADYQDFVESESIYELLEREMIPEFYERGSDGLPRGWIARMKASIRTCAAAFSAVRMVREYTTKLYLPALANALYLAEKQFSAAKSLAKWRRRMAQRWGGVAVTSFKAIDNGDRLVGSDLRVQAEVRLGDIDPDEVAVQLYHGTTPDDRQIEQAEVVTMTCTKTGKDGVYEYVGSAPCIRSGQYGYAVRVLPQHPDIAGQYDLRRLTWG